MPMSSRALVLVLLSAVAFPAPALAPATADFNGDGRADVLWRNSSTGADAIWRSADQATQQAVASVTDPRWKVAGVGDFDGDGRSDIFWRNTSTGANAIWKSANRATQQPAAAVTDQTWQVAGVGDFDRDGRSDVLWRNSDTGANAIWKAANRATQIGVAAVADQAWSIVAVADFDGDGASDILWRNTGTGSNAIWRSANRSTPQAVTRVGNLAWRVAGSGDFDGDGRADILWRNTSTGTNSIWKAANAAAQQPVASVSSQDWRVVRVGDFQGDGRADVFWRNLATGADVVWRSADASARQATGSVGNLAWVVVPRGGQDFRPTLSIADVSIAEGDSGVAQAAFAVRLTWPSTSRVTYDIGTFDSGGNVDATADADYRASSMTGQSIPAGQTSASFVVTINGDTMAEANETFLVAATRVAGAVELKNVATGTIRNDDANTLWIDDASVIEGDTGTKPMTFTIRLSRPSTLPVTYDIATADLPPSALFRATAGVDYVAKRLTGEVMPPGATSRTFTVTIINDTVEELIGESFNVDVSHAAGIVVVDARADGNIVDDESPVP